MLRKLHSVLQAGGRCIQVVAAGSKRASKRRIGWMSWIAYLHPLLFRLDIHVEDRYGQRTA
jgi:hypothetical protein